jgi:hypothetical protein
MMCRKTIGVAVLAMAPAFAAQAADPLSSSYWEAAYLSSTIDTGAPETDEVEGLRGKVSVGLLPYLNFVGDFDQRRQQNTRDSFYSVGLAGHTLDPTWQVFGAATYEKAEFDDTRTSPPDHEEDGYGVELGGRAVIDNFEIHASYKYFDLSKVTPTLDLSGSRYGGGFALDLSAWWSLVADYSVRTHELETTTTPSSSNDVEWQEWSVGLRRYFVTQTDGKGRTGGIFKRLLAATDGE